jgi:hypothetical protein
LLQLARTRRQRRSGEWTEAKAVTFTVTLAASRSVTFAAARAGMSRKAAYSLKRRDSSFASAWHDALSVLIDPRRCRAKCSAQGDKIDEIDSPRFRRRRGYRKGRALDGPFDAIMRDLFFATIANRSGADCPAPLARDGTLP